METRLCLHLRQRLCSTLPVDKVPGVCRLCFAWLDGPPGCGHLTPFYRQPKMTKQSLLSQLVTFRSSDMVGTQPACLEEERSYDLAERCMRSTIPCARTERFYICGACHACSGYGVLQLANTGAAKPSRNSDASGAASKFPGACFTSKPLLLKFPRSVSLNHHAVTTSR